MSDRLGDVLTIGAGGLFLATYNLAGAYAALARLAPAIRGAWPHVAVGGIAVSILLGAASGRQCSRWIGRRAQAPWLAVLPWPPAAKRRAVRVASLAAGGVLMPLPAFCALGVSHAVAAPHQGMNAAALGLCFLAGFALAALPTPIADARAAEPGQPVRQRRTPLVWRLTERLDRQAPRWVGAWAQTDDGRRLARFWIGSLGLGAGIATAASVPRGWVAPVVVTAVVGGNLVYLAGLRADPLLSPVLRASPVRFAAAWIGVARRPLALSLAWFGVAVLPAFAVSIEAWRPALGGLAVLLVLDLLFSTAVAMAPGSRRQAALIYAVALIAIARAGLEYGPAYGGLAALAVFAVAAWMWRRARRRFRSDG